MGAKMYGSRSGKSADNDNHKQRVNEKGEIPIPPDERRVAPVIEAVPDRAWFCLVTAPQNEYRCSDGLQDCGVATYVPTRTYWEPRRKGKALYPSELQAPLFRSYVFANLSKPVWRETAAGTYVTLGDDWNPIFERDAWDRSRLGVLRFLGEGGCPAPMPLYFVDAEGNACGIASLADEERAGWFDSRKRPFLEADRERRKAQAEAKARRAEQDAQRAEEEAKRLRKPVWAGDLVRARTGVFAGHKFTAENDNDDRGIARLSRMMFGQVAIVTVSVAELENLTRPYATPHIDSGNVLKRA